MELAALREAKQASPFKPFRLRLADGRAYLIPHRDFIGLPEASRRVLIYGPDDKDYEIVDPMLIVSVSYGNLPTA